MKELTWMIMSLVLFLITLPVLSFGTDAGQPVVWWIGLALIGVAGAIPPVLRFVPLDDDEDDGNGDADAEATAGNGVS